MKLGVGFLDVAAFLQRAARGADAKPEVPESARKFRDERAELLLGFFVAEEKEQVQVRIREKHFTAVAAEGQQGHALPGTATHTQQFPENFFDRAVGQLTQLPKRLAGAGSVLK